MDAAQQLMNQFRLLVKTKGWTVEELWDLLRQGVMCHCEPSYSTVAKWLVNTTASGAHLLAILTFVETHRKSKGSPNRKPKDQCNSVNRQTAKTK